MSESSERIARYIAAQQAATAAGATASMIVEKAVRMADSLRGDRWKSVFLVTQHQRAPGPSITVSDWPGADELQRPLDHWREMRRELVGAWNALTGDEQRSLRPPD